MKNRNGKWSRTMNVGVVSMEKFCTVYNEVSETDGITPVASLTIPLLDSNGGTLYQDKDSRIPLYSCVIFYELTEPDNRTLDKSTGKVAEPKKISVVI